MESNLDLENKERFKINPHVWLQTLLALVGDKDRKKAVVESVARQTGCSPRQVESILATTIQVLVHQTRAN